MENFTKWNASKKFYLVLINLYDYGIRDAFQHISTKQDDYTDAFDELERRYGPF